MRRATRLAEPLAIFWDGGGGDGLEAAVMELRIRGGAIAQSRDWSFDTGLDGVDGWGRKLLWSVFSGGEGWKMTSWGMELMG